MNNKKVRITVDILLIIVGIVLLVFAIKDTANTFSKNRGTDAERFFRSYSHAGKDNIYKYAKIKEINKILESGSGVIVLGNTTDTWMQVVVNPLQNECKETVDKIYYLELDDIDKNEKEYQKLEASLKDISSPRILVVKEGKVLSDLKKADIFEEDYDGIPIEYFTQDRIENFSAKLKISELK